MLNNTKIAIIEWYKKHHRKLPWRETSDAYSIWLSEIILQQTRVQQGLPYYSKFQKNYPTVVHFAQAQESEILHLWQGLGYYSRARNMHSTAKNIVENYGGKFPASYQELLKLKGIGEYTAAAIASFAFQLPHAAVDGNVIRVISRLYGIEEDIANTKTKKIITYIAQEMMGISAPDLFNQSMIEFGALLCKAKSPDCGICPLAEQCYALANNKVSVLPYKAKQTKVRSRFLNYLIIKIGENKLYIRQRKGKDIWQNLYDFPVIESENPIDESTLIHQIRKKIKCPSSIIIQFRSTEIKHKLSHQLLHIQFSVLRCDNLKPGDDWIKVSVSQLSEFPFPEIINKNKELLIKKIQSQ